MRLVSALMVGLLLVSGPAYASPILIDIISATYTTKISVSSPDGIIRETVSPNPITDSWLIPAPLIPGLPQVSEVGASASADTLAINVVPISVPWFPPAASALAKSEIEFSPLHDGLATVTLMSNFPCPWAQRSVSLVNLTSSQEVWSYGFSCFPGNPDPSTVQWSHSNDVMAPTLFNSSDRYLLTLSAFSSAVNDGGLPVAVHVSGLQAVPEPTTLSLLALGLAALYRRHGNWALARSGSRPVRVSSGQRSISTPEPS